MSNEPGRTSLKGRDLFTGIIEELGTVQGIDKRGGLIRLTLKADSIVKDAKIGDSLTVNGVCLTAVGINRNLISFDVIRATQQTTNLGKLRKGEKVNLERSLKAGDRLSGHFVTGHIDCMGKIIKRKKAQRETFFQIEIPAKFLNLVVSKGSIAVDGVSLTVADIDDSSFSVNLIPHTLSITTLGFKSVSSKVNVEVDILAKFVSKFATKDIDGISKDFLKEQGFI